MILSYFPLAGVLATVFYIYFAHPYGYQDTISILLFIWGIPSVLWALIFLLMGEKFCLTDECLMIKKLSPIWRKAKIVPYSDILKMEIGSEAATFKDSSVDVPIVYLTLKNGKVIRMDVPTGKKQKEFLLGLKQNIDKFAH